MDPSNEEFARVTAILKELGKENLLQVFHTNELMDDVLDCLETESEMRTELTELKGEEITRGSAIKFSKAWFSYKKSGTATSRNDANISNLSIPLEAGVSDIKEKKKQAQETCQLTIEEQDNASAIHEKVATTGANALAEHKNVEHESEGKAIGAQSHVGGSPAKSTKEKEKPMESTSPKTSLDINNSIVLKSDSQKYSPAKCQDNNTQLVKQTTSNESKGKKVDLKSNIAEQGKKHKKKTVPVNDVREPAIPRTVDKDHCARRSFGQPEDNLKYEKGTVFLNAAENEKIEFKSLTQEAPQKLPWKIMEKAKDFMCGVLNSGSSGTIYFGIGDSVNNATKFNHGEVIGLEVEDLKDDINKAFQSTLDDHIKSDDGKMNSCEMKAIKIHYVPVWQSNKKTSSYVIEIDVERDWASCRNHVYYVDKWEESGKWDGTRKPRLHDLYKMKKGTNEQAYLRTCGATQSVKNSDTNKRIKEPLSHMYDKWKEEDRKNQYTQMFNQETATTLDNQKISEGIRESLRQLNTKEINYVLIASKVPHQYRGTNKITFLKSISWFFVFDLFDPKSKTDGLYYILNEANDSDRARLTYLEDYDDNVKKDHSTLDWRATTWVLRGEKQHDRDWTRHSKHNVYQAFLTCQKQSPAGHIHCVFLCLNDEFLVEMADIIDLLFTILGKEANQRISIISEKEEIGKRMIKPLKNSIRNDLNYPCTILGVPLDLLKIIIEEMLGPNNFCEPNATTDLPHIRGSISILNKRINALTDLEVYCPKPSLTTSLKEIKKVRDDFYKGGDIKQINLFHRHDIQRTLQDALTRRADTYLKKLSNPIDQDYTGCVETVFLSYEPGSGATTLCRRILWEKRERYRCAVLKTIGTNTFCQIEELQMFSYETGQFPFIPPVLILADNFPDHEVHHLIDKLLERNTKCVLLITTPIANATKDSKDEFAAHLGELDEIEIQRVDKILVDIEDKSDEKKKAAADILKRERRFIWFGLELFGRLYNEIEERLTNHIQQTISSHFKEKLKDAYKMILNFCCLFYCYSKGRSIFPHSCILDILDKRDGLEKGPTNQIVRIHSKFAGLLLEDRSESDCYQGWRPAHFLVGEIVMREMDLIATVKNLCTEIKDNVRPKTRAKEVLTKAAVTICLKRDSESIEDIEGIEEDDFGLFEKQKYSALLLDVMPTTSELEVTNALDLLVNLHEIAEEIVDLNAYCSQQLARVLAYEVGTKTISPNDASLLSKLSPSIHPVSNDSPMSGLEAAHQVIDLAVNLQPKYGHHLVTKGTFCKTELTIQLHELQTGNRHDFATEVANLENFVKKAINITKKGISLYDKALTKTSSDSYLYAMLGKIEIMITLLEILKNLPCFFEHELGPDENFKMYMH